MNRLTIIFLFTALLSLPAAGQSQHTAPAKPKFKAIFEPVNYPEDAELRDVFFVSRDVGWAVGLVPSDAGDGGVILHTTDGGEHWNVQIGGPHSAMRAFQQVWFLDATHGWATEAGEGGLLRTADGDTWESIRPNFPTNADFVFTSPDVGLWVNGAEIRRTTDGGRTWKMVFLGREKVTDANGLTQEAQFNWNGISCPTASACFAGSGTRPDKASAIATTEDGGLTWSISQHVPDARCGAWGMLFLDPKTGFMRNYAELRVTADGGATWRKVPGAFPQAEEVRVRFADHSVGWVAQGRTIAYTSDSGKHWNGVEVRLPSDIFAGSLPAPDRGYLVGTHGMVYRYRIVPADYSSKGMISAPVIAPTP
jgi:photosystem II stability/assembly factor-like uncharacterized protein